MQNRKLQVGLVMGLSMVGLASSAQALPSLNVGTQDTSSVQKVDYRRCWWHDGIRHCRWIRDGAYYYDDGYYAAPFVGFAFGGGRGFRGHGGHGGHGHRR